MVPPQEPTEDLYELRAIADNVVRERCETSEVHPPISKQYESDVLRCKVEATNATNVGNMNLSNADVVKDVQPPVEPQSNKHAEDSVSTHGDVHVGPACRILMTQAELDWQDSVSRAPSSSFNATQNLPNDIDVVGRFQTTVDTFAEVSQIAEEAVMDATH